MIEKPKIDDISMIAINCCSQYFDLNMLDNKLLKSRKREIVDARTILLKIIKDNTKISLSRIGSYFGKNHATVMHSVKKFDLLYNQSKEFANDYNIVNGRFKVIKEEYDTMLNNDLTIVKTEICEANNEINRLIKELSNANDKIESLKLEIGLRDKRIEEIISSERLLEIYVEKYNKLISNE